MTTQPSQHIVKSYDDQLNRLTREIVRMGELATAQLKSAIDALVRRDDDGASAVIHADEAIDALEQDIAREAVQLLVARAPMARDLREVVAALRVSADLERIGDSSQVTCKHQVKYAKPTTKGRVLEEATTSTPLHVGRGGALSLFPESQTDMFQRTATASAEPAAD